jgi:hypothetical protein
MSYAPFPSNDGSEPQDTTRAAGLRLRDAEKIAANRLDGGGDGSLKDALADVVANGTPRDDIERLTDRIGAAQAAYVAPSDAPTLPFPADGPNFGFGGEKKEHAPLDLPQWSEARATVAAELADMQSQPLFLQTDQQQLGGGTHWQPTEQDAEPYHPVQPEPAHTFVAETAPIAEPPHAEPPLPEPPRAEPPRPEPPLPEPPRAELPLTQPPREATVAPINTALDAAAKLAADADAAAAALESLTRMLQAHRRPASTIPAPHDVAQRRPVEPDPRPAASEPHAEQMAPRPAAAEAYPAHANYAQAAPRPDVPERDPLQMAPRQPRPIQRPVQLVPRPETLPEPLRPVRPPMLRPTPMARDQRQFDLRGFMAGFAFAWAIGAIIYIYLLAG